MTITDFRRELFRLSDKALGGKRVEYLYKGVVLQVVPETTNARKLDALIGQPTLVPDVDMEQAGRELLAEMEAEWLKDWSEI